ncbi:hypothetical protein T08_14064 [Trichinella sp. T8]|nr:hypothetical protein T08_14064 [Trichinella sp. T8]
MRQRESNPVSSARQAAWLTTVLHAAHVVSNSKIFRYLISDVTNLTWQIPLQRDGRFRDKFSPSNFTGR